MPSNVPDPATCPFEVPRAVMLQRWEQLTFLHWPFAAETVQRLLPGTLEVETFDGSAWVGLVPFRMVVTVPGVAPAPWLSRFCETNVRTYVRSRLSGRSGIWFFSLDAARLPAVLVARALYGLPYVWSRMSLAADGGAVRYQARRRWPGPRGAVSAVGVEVGRRLRPAEVTALDHFLTARWIVFARARRHARFGRASHPPWPLHEAGVAGLRDEFVEAAGLPPPQGQPLVRYSPGVDVRIGRFELAGPPG